MHLIPRSAPFLGAALCLFLAACGGSGGGATAEPTVSSNPAPAENLIVNADFSRGIAGWAPQSAVEPSIVTDVYGHAVSLAGRTGVGDGVRQDIQASLTAADNGRPVVTRMKIKLAQPASVRAFLEITGTQGLTRVLLAEKVVRAADRFVTVEGAATLAWQGGLVTARFSVEVGRLPEKIYPDYLLDDLFMARDSDADGLSDGEEGALGTDPSRNDSDSDGMLDGWETANGLDPRRNDAHLDTDGDGFSHGQEFWAATDPHDPYSYPGKSANPNLTADGRAILRYLALLPSNTANRVIAGQHVADAASGDIQGYDHNVAALEAQTGKGLGIVELQYDGATGSQYQIAAVNLLAETIWKAGGRVEIKWNPWIPWSGKSYNDITGFAAVDIAGMLARNTPANSQAMATFNGYLDTVAAGLEDLQRKNIVVLWRFMSEMNGPWFWWGHRPQADYVALWRYIHSYLTAAKGLNNLIWVYESDSGVHGITPSDYYFPGADVVDVVGHNLYSDTWQLPYDLNALYREYGKVYALPQAGSAGKSAVRTTRFGWDNLVIIDGIKARHPRASYFCVWNSFTSAAGTQYIAIIDERNSSALLSDPWVVTRDELAWRQPGP